MESSALLEPIISQNDFILSLWQTFMTAHFAIVAGLITHRKPINVTLAFVLLTAYLCGLYINGNSLIDAYRQLAAFQKDFVVISNNGTSASLQNTKEYIEKFLDYPTDRALKVRIMYFAAGAVTILGFIWHYMFHSKKTTKHKNT